MAGFVWVGVKGRVLVPQLSGKSGKSDWSRKSQLLPSQLLFSLLLNGSSKWLVNFRFIIYSSNLPLLLDPSRWMWYTSLTCVRMDGWKRSGSFLGFGLEMGEIPPDFCAFPIRSFDLTVWIETTTGAGASEIRNERKNRHPQTIPTSCRCAQCPFRTTNRSAIHSSRAR